MQVTGSLSDYSLDKTLVFTSASPITADTFKLKPTFGDINALVVLLTVENSIYKIYYLSRAFQLCLEREGQGVILYNVYPAQHYEFQISGSAVSINSNVMGFDSSTAKCPYTSFLGVESFSWNVAELIIDSTFATSISSSLVGFTQLPMESCQTEASAGVCQTCVPRYTLNTPNCDPLAYGYETANTCYSPFQFNGSVNKCVDGKSLITPATGAYASMNIVNSNPKLNVDYGSPSWTAQLYLYLSPLFQNSQAVIAERIIDFQNSSQILRLRGEATQAFNPNINKIKLLFRFYDNSDFVFSGYLDVAYGEWLLVTVEAHSVNQVYTLFVENYGSMTLTGQPHFTGTQVRFRADGVQIAHLIKEVIIWNTAIADTPSISAHKCNFNHAVSFLPLSQFNLNFTRASTATEIVDQRGTAASVAITNLDTMTVAEAIQQYPPIAPLPGTMLYSNVASSVACVECMPNCQVCSDIFACTTCSTGTKIGGICLTAALSGNSGAACSDTFSFDTSDFTQINRYLTNQIKEASSTQQIAYSAKLIYPDSSQIQISDLSSFTVPNYYELGTTSFNANVQLSFTLNSVTTQTDLGNISLTQPAKNPPNCKACMPNCSECSDIYVCDACSAGSLVHGLCITSILSQTNGQTADTLFSFEVTDFTTINSHINTQLGVSSSTQQVSFTYLKLVYPDSSVVYVNDPSSFTIPIYKVSEVTSFKVNCQLYFTVNGQSKHSDLAQIQMSQTAYVPSNICGCRAESECNSVTRVCTCQPGYAGTHCTYTEAQLATQQAQVSSQINNIETTLGTTTSNSVALTQLGELTSEESAVTDQTALQTNNILSQIVSQNSTEAQLQEVVQVESNLLPKVQTGSSDTSSLSQSIQDILAQLVASTIQNGSNISISTTNIFVVVVPLNADPSSANSTDVKVTVPSGVSSTCADSKLSKVLYKGSLYATPSGLQQASDILTLELYSCQQKQNVANLDENVELQFPINSSDTATLEKIYQISNGTSSQSDVSCSYYNQTLNSISSDGCTVLNVTSESIKCGCNHMTDFMVFLKTGEEVLEGGNYFVIMALPELNLDNLQSNIGLYFAVGYWGLYLSLCLIFGLGKLKRRQAESQYRKIMEFLYKQDQILNEGKDQRDKRMDKIQEKLNKEQSAKVHPYNPRSLEFNPNEMSSNMINYAVSCRQNSHNELSGFNCSVTPEPNPQQARLAKSKKVKRAQTEVRQPYVTKEQMIRGRILISLKGDPKCCCAFRKLFENELQTNNSFYNFYRGVTILVPVSLRLAFIFMAILLEFALNALFYNLNPSQEDTSLFWDGIMENIWISFISIILAMIPLCALGFCCTASSKIKYKLKQAKNIRQFKQIYEGRKMKRNIRCKTIGGLIFFVLVSIFLLLYIICFCHVANEIMTEDWVRGSAILVILDILVLELVPGILFGILGLFWIQCHRNNFMLCLIVVIETYRLYRNLIEV